MQSRARGEIIKKFFFVMLFRFPDLNLGALSAASAARRPISSVILASRSRRAAITEVTSSLEASLATKAWN